MTSRRASSSTTPSCSVKNHTTDYDGVDITIASSVEYEVYYAVDFELQLKCTSRTDIVHDTHVTWSMEERSFRKLTNSKRYNTAYLGVLIVPDDVTAWLAQDEERLFTRSRMYWQSAAELGTIDDGKATKTVRLPRRNIFDVPHLLGIMRRLGEEGDR